MTNPILQYYMWLFPGTFRKVKTAHVAVFSKLLTVFALATIYQTRNESLAKAVSTWCEDGLMLR